MLMFNLKFSKILNFWLKLRLEVGRGCLEKLTRASGLPNRFSTFVKHFSKKIWLALIEDPRGRRSRSKSGCRSLQSLRLRSRFSIKSAFSRGHSTECLWKENEKIFNHNIICNYSKLISLYKMISLFSEKHFLISKTFSLFQAGHAVFH